MALVAGGQFDSRIGLLEKMENAFHREYQADLINDHKTTYERAVKLMQSKEAKAFDLSAESTSSRRRYGSGRFADGVVMARRLVEVGVPFIEVSLGGWDTHQDNFDRVKNLSAQVDPAMSQLVLDLKERGLLDSTLVVWMGDFGRTPKINARGTKPGRDHYPKAWTSVMVGGGIKGGQVIGRTDRDGAAVVDRPIGVPDFLATVCTILGIDYKRKNYPPGVDRPIPIVDTSKGVNVLTELL